MNLLTKDQHAQLIANGKASAIREIDHFPVVKLFTPDTQFTWLLSEIRADDLDCAFGLCDLGMGCPELGYVSLSELANVRGTLGLPIERDRHFVANRSLTVYAKEAATVGYIQV